MEDEGKLKEKKNEEERLRKLQLNSTEEGRRKIFRDSIRDGRKYPCICCHRLCFKNSVQVFSNEF